MGLELQHVFPCLYDTRIYHFWTVSSQEMRNGSLITMWYKKKLIIIKWTLSNYLEGWTIIQRTQCCACDWILEDPSIMNFFRWMKLLTLHFEGRNWSKIDMELFSIRIMPNCMSKSARFKNWRALVGIFFWYAPSDYYLFRSMEH